MSRDPRRLETLFEHAPDMMNLHDAEGTILDVNERFCAVLGREREDVLGKKIWEIDTEIEPDGIQQKLGRIEPGERIAVETRFERDDGTTFPVELNVRCVDVDDERLFVVISRDISERKRREQRLQRQNERLEAFASTVSHDLRNPLATAHGYLDLARESGDPEDFDRIDQSLTRMERIIDDVLWLAREGQEIGSTSDVELATAVADAWTVVGGAGGDARIEIEDGLGTVTADSDRLRQLIENLLGNAVDHGGEVVRVEPTADGFAIEDDGPGIPESERERVFERGHTLSEDGSGLGLAIVDEIAEAHGWSVEITDGDLGGARFEVTTDG
ncbi:sensor histidine kinase [Natronomonas pharaonis]|nr:PAS domain-containing sensor histidine kinase [Natronomonas pharaonis]